MSAEFALAYTIDSDGLRLAVRLTPQVGRDALDGVSLGA